MARLRLVLGIILSAATAGVPMARAQTLAPTVLLELFTSQGCSSCPPADALLPSFIARRDVVALSLPVDYWDRLGWKDTFAKPEFTRRQYQYAERRGDRQVYTPQAVVSGKFHVVGSVKADIERAISVAQQDLRSSPIAMRVGLDTKSLVIEIDQAPKALGLDGARVLLALVQREGHVAVKRGENADRHLAYHNIVRELVAVGDWQGAPAHWRIPSVEFADKGVQSLVVMVQKSPGGPIIAVTQRDIAIPG